MKKNKIWLLTEWKRAAGIYPSILLKAIILALLASLVAFLCCHLFVDRDERAYVKIGYEIDQDEMSELATNYVKEMESVNSLCELIPMEMEEGQRKLALGEIKVFLVFPDRVVEGILNGENKPVKLYLPANQDIESKIFYELISSLVSMLQTAQAQIYTTGDLYRQYELNDVDLNQIYEQIDRMNLQIAMNREQFFKIRDVSSTGSESFAIYYGGVFLTICFLLIEILVGREYIIDRDESLVIAKRLGIPLIAQIALRSLILIAMLVITFIPIIGITFLPSVSHLFHIEISGKALIYFILSSLVMSAIIQLVGFLGASRIHRTWILSITGVIASYLCGCMLPTALLPDVLEQIEKYIPLTYLRKAFTSVLGGDIKQFETGVMILLIWVAVFAILAVIVVNTDFHGINHNNIRADKGERIIQITFRRLLSQKLFWLVLICSCMATIIFSFVEKHTVNSLRAAIYTENEELKELLKNRDGFVQFSIVNSEEELKRKIVKENMICGYVLQDELQNDIRDGNGNWSVIVYRNSESTLMPVINESLFSTLFYNITTEWYEGYIANNKCFVKIEELIGEERFTDQIHDFYQKRLSDDSTFQIEENIISDNQLSEEKTTQPIFPGIIILVCNLLFSTLTGLYTVWNDRTLNRYPKGMISRINLCTIMLPIVISSGVCLCTMVLTKYI